MTNLTLFLNSFLSYFVMYAVFLVLIIVSVLMGIKVRKIKNEKEAVTEADVEEKKSI